jgi:hypothetical protein
MSLMGVTRFRDGPGVTRFREGLGRHESLGQDYLARYTAPQARGAVGGEVLSSSFYLYDRGDVVIPNGYIFYSPLPFFFTCFPSF